MPLCARPLTTPTAAPPVEPGFHSVAERYTIRRYSHQSAMKLHFQAYGAGHPLIILHGLFGSSDNWRGMSRRLANFHRVFAVDLRNHGRSPHSDSFTYEAMSEDLRRLLQEQSLRSVYVLGHSLGGKVAMQFATDYPAMVEKLIVVDIAPKSYEPSQRGLLEAMHSLELTRCRSFADADAALAGEIPDRSLRQFLLKNLTRDHNGRLRWRIHLEAIARSYDRLTRAIAPERSFDKPARFLRGGRSDYILDRDVPLIRRIFPRAEVVTLPTAGHWAHIDAPEEFFQTVVNFLGGS